MKLSKSKISKLRKDNNLILMEEARNIASRQSLKNACISCTEQYNCCRNQSTIRVHSQEIKDIKHLIEKKHITRILEQKKIKADTGKYSCPFNDPETGKCDIYEDRFTICSVHMAIGDPESCNSLKNENGTNNINIEVVFENLKNNHTVFSYQSHLSNNFTNYNEKDLLTFLVKTI